jgi:hypothetical protein
MVKHLALAAVLLSSTAAIADDDEDDAGFNMLGARFTFGSTPIHETSSLTVSLGLGVEHPVFRRTRVFGEYDWLWLSSAPAPMDSAPAHHGSGHRAVAGLRRELIGTGRHSVHAFIDGELGGGVMLANDSMFGLEVVPTGFIGMRLGYDIYSHNDDSPSRTFELEILTRVLVVPDGVGFLTGLGMAWGN